MDSESASEIKFKTYLNYLKNFDQILKNQYVDSSDLIKRIWLDNLSLQGSKIPNLEPIKRLLFIAWNTEFLATSQPTNEIEILRINNHWKPIQVYYSIYSCGQALTNLINGTQKSSHATCLKTLSNFFGKKEISPWNLVCTGKLGKNGKNLEFINFPEGIQPQHNLKTRNVVPEEIIATCLRAEHKIRIGDGYKKGVGRKYDFNPGPTTLFYLAYRLRLKANYQEMDMYLAKTSHANVYDFDKFLTSFCQKTLIALEIPIIRKISKKNFIEFGKEYISLNTKATHLQNRLNDYQQLLL